MANNVGPIIPVHQDEDAAADPADRKEISGKYQEEEFTESVIIEELETDELTALLLINDWDELKSAGHRRH